MIKEAAQNLFNRKEITKEEFGVAYKIHEEFEKCSSVAGFMKGLEKLRPVGVGAALLTGAGFGAKELYDIVSQQAKIRRSFKQIKEKIPQLKEQPEEKLKDYFEVIKTFSPRAASNPLVAGALINKMIEFGGVDHRLVQDIATIESRKPESLLFNIARAGALSATGIPGQKDKKED